MGLPDKLDKLTHKAIHTLDGAMSEQDTDPELVALQRMKSAAATAVLATRQRADEAVFRIQQNDRLAELLEQVLRRKAELRAVPFDEIANPAVSDYPEKERH